MLAAFALSELLCSLSPGRALAGPSAFLAAEEEAREAFSAGDWERGTGLVEGLLAGLRGRPDHPIRLAEAYLRQAAYQYNEAGYEAAYRLGAEALEAAAPLFGSPDPGLRARAQLCRADALERFMGDTRGAAEALREAEAAEPGGRVPASRIRRLETAVAGSEAKIEAAARRAAALDGKGEQ